MPKKYRDAGQFEIESILDHRQNGQSDREFKIRWKGYGPSDDTWEPEENLNDHDILKYMNENGIYEVESIVDHRQNGQSEREYKVRWRGYGPSDDTWEPETDLLDLEIFMEYINEHDIYEVEAIVDDCVFPRKRKRVYKVRWAGYGPSDDTWEPQSSLQHLDIWREYEKKRMRKRS